jgi:AcrR family transcriptional regulator
MNVVQDEHLAASGLSQRLDPDRYSATQRRSIDAAFQLFAIHGVGGSSFQMVADAVGLTKAAIYYQFRTKEAIVLAVAEVYLSPMQAALDEAEAEPDRDRARSLLLTRVVDMAVDRRQWVSALQSDPAMTRLFRTHPPFADLLTRVYSLLMNEHDGPSTAVRAAVASSALGGAVVHPMVAHLDADTLRRELLAVTRRLFDLPNNAR